MNKLLNFIHSFLSLKNYTLRNFTVFLLVLFCIQYIPIESRGGVSIVKVVTMIICPFIFIMRTAKISKGFIILTLYYALVLFAAISHPEPLG